MITDRMKDLAIYFDSRKVINLVESAVYHTDGSSLMRYAIDLRKHISPKQSIKQKLAIIEEQIELQAADCVGDAEKMKGHQARADFQGYFDEIDEWYAGVCKK